MKFINNKLEFGGILSLGINYSRTHYLFGLILPIWFPFHGRYVPNDRFGASISIVVPVIKVFLQKESKSWRWWIHIERWELKRMYEIAPIMDLIRLIYLHSIHLHSGWRLRIITDMIRQLNGRGLSSSKIESLLKGVSDGGDKLGNG